MMYGLGIIKGFLFFKNSQKIRLELLLSPLMKEKLQL